MPFIYKITNTINNKVYIGKSKYDRKDYFGSGIKINLALHKYGRATFTKSIIEECSAGEVNSREVYWITFYQSTQDAFGYNISKGGDGGDHYWATLTDEARAIHNKKISDSKIGKSHGPHSDATKKKMADSFNHDPEYLKKRGQAKCKVYTCINHLTIEKFITVNLKGFCQEKKLSYASMQGNARRSDNRSALSDGIWSCSVGELSGPVEAIIRKIVEDMQNARKLIKDKMRGKDNKGNNNPMWGRKHSLATKEKMRMRYLERPKQHE